MDGIRIETINLNTNQRLEVESFLSTFNLFFDRDIEETIVAKRNNEILGTCSYSGNILKCFAVKEGLQGEGIASKLITHITNNLFDKGIFEFFIFTKPENINIFKGLNYREISTVEGVSLLEGGMANIEKYIQSMYMKSGAQQGKKAALVMNCNPFTLGHRYLIEKASKENEQVVVFVVEEDKSSFPFDVRLDLIQKGIRDLKNVHVIPGGHYIISSATFPTYFIKEDAQKTQSYTQLDASIFSKYIAPVFNIKKRYVGTEPFSKTTKEYNNALSSILPQYGIEVIEVERVQKEDRAISASRVREIIRQGNLESLQDLVPSTTYEYIMSNEAESVIQKIQSSISRH